MSALPETIQTERLALRPHHFDDVEDILAYATDEEWSRYMPIPHPYHRNDAEDWIARQTIRDKEVHGAWAIVMEETVIGGIDLILTPMTKSGVLGYAPSLAHWNKGMITEAVRAVCDCAFENVAELNRIWAWADSRNAGSLRVMEKLGMTREGCLRQHKVIRGELVDAVHGAILRAEWEKRRV